MHFGTMDVVVLVSVLVVLYPLCKFILFLVRLHSTTKVLNRMPHVKSSGLVGWKEMLQAPHRLPQLTTKAADELGGIYSFRIAFFHGVVVSDPALAHHVLSKLDLPKHPQTYGVINTLTSPGGRQPNLLGHFTHDGYWRLVRKGTAPAFSPKHIRGEFPHVVELTQQICAALSSAGPATYLDLDNLFQRESLDVIGRIGFATDFGAIRGFKHPHTANPAAGAGSHGGKHAGGTQQDGKVAAAAKAPAGAYFANTVLDTDDIFEVVRAAGAEIVKRFTEPWRVSLRHISADARRGENCMQAFQSHMWRLMREIRARGEPEPDDMSVAAHLLRIRDPQTGRPLTDEQLASEIGVFFFAGFETTGHSMAWTLYFLASHPDVEGKVCAELDALGLLATPSRPSPRPLAYDDLGKLKYLGCAIKEAMRLSPVVAGGTGRVCDRPLELGGYIIPAGVQIIVPLHGMMTSSRNWERPNEYRPERWEEPGVEYWHGPVNPSGGRPEAAEKLGAPAGAGGAQAGAPAAKEGDNGILEEEDDTSKAEAAKRPPRRFLPFSEGTRGCIGQNLAKMNYTATLAILLSHFSFELPPELRGPGALAELQCYRTTLQPANGLPLRCIPRLT